MKRIRNEPAVLNVLVPFNSFSAIFLKIEYSAASVVAPPRDINLSKGKYQLKAFLISANKLSDFADQVVLKALEALGDRDEERQSQQRQQSSQRKGRNGRSERHRRDSRRERTQTGGEGTSGQSERDDRARPPRIADLNLYAQQIVEDMKTCEFEDIGKTGSSEFQNFGNGYTGFSRYRINCLRMNNQVLVVLGLIRVIYRSSRFQDDERQERGNDNDLHGILQNYADYKLRAEVISNYSQYIRNKPLLPLTPNDQQPTSRSFIHQSFTPADPSVQHSRRWQRIPLPGNGGGGYVRVQEGDKLKISGVPTKNADSLEINLEGPGGLLVLQISVEFVQNTTVVLNSYDPRNGLDTPMKIAVPISKSASFNFEIKFHSDEYEIIFNPHHTTNFQYRYLLNMVQYVSFSGASQVRAQVFQ